MVKDLYNPQLQNTNPKDSLSDNFFGTNNVALKNMQNGYEMTKAETINKYDWNKQGMIQAGINPLLNSSGLNGVTQAPASNMSKSNDLLSRVLNKSLEKVEKSMDSDTALKVISLLA